MPLVEEVLDHWIEAYSNSPIDPYSEDHLFFFGYKKPLNILVTTCLSAVTLGINREHQIVGTAGARVSRYVYYSAGGALQYKVIPPSNDWNSERISRCVSVVVRLTVFYANAWSLNTVYVFQQASAFKLPKLQNEKLVAFSPKKKKVLYALNIAGDREELKEHWETIEEEVRREGALLAGLRPGQVDVVRVRAGVSGPLQIDPKTRKWSRLKKQPLKDFDLQSS